MLKATSSGLVDPQAALTTLGNLSSLEWQAVEQIFNTAQVVEGYATFDGFIQAQLGEGSTQLAQYDLIKQAADPTLSEQTRLEAKIKADALSLSETLKDGDVDQAATMLRNHPYMAELQTAFAEVKLDPTLVDMDALEFMLAGSSTSIHAGVSQAEYASLAYQLSAATTINDLSTESYQQLSALAEGKTELADAYALKSAIEAGNVQAIEQIYARNAQEAIQEALAENPFLTTAELQAVVQHRNQAIEGAYAMQIGGEYGTANLLQQAMETSLSGTDLQLATGLRDYDLAQVDTARLDKAMATGDVETARMVLQSQQLRAQQDVYRDDLATFAQDQLADGVPVPAITEAWLSQQEQAKPRLDGLVAAETEARLEQLQTDSQFNQYNPEQSYAIELVETLFTGQGELTAQQQLFFGIQLGNEALLHSALMGKSLEEIEAMDYAYQEELVDRGKASWSETESDQYGRPVAVSTEVVTDPTAGYDSWSVPTSTEIHHTHTLTETINRLDFDNQNVNAYFGKMLEGSETPEKQVDLMETLLDQETGPGSGIGTWFAPQERAMMEYAVTQAGMIEEKLAGLDLESAEAQALQGQLDGLSKVMDYAVGQHQQQIDGIANAASMAAGMASLVAMVALSGGSLSPVALMMLGTAIGSGGNIALQAALRGDRYLTSDQFGQDSSMVAVEVALGLATLGLGKAAMSARWLDTASPGLKTFYEIAVDTGLTVAETASLSGVDATVRGTDLTASTLVSSLATDMAVGKAAEIRMGANGKLYDAEGMAIGRINEVGQVELPTETAGVPMTVTVNPADGSQQFSLPSQVAGVPPTPVSTEVVTTLNQTPELLTAHENPAKVVEAVTALQASSPDVEIEPADVTRWLNNQAETEATALNAQGEAVTEGSQDVFDEHGQPTTVQVDSIVPAGEHNVLVTADGHYAVCSTCHIVGQDIKSVMDNFELSAGSPAHTELVEQLNLAGEPRTTEAVAGWKDAQVRAEQDLPAIEGYRWRKELDADGQPTLYSTRKQEGVDTTLETILDPSREGGPAQWDKETGAFKYTNETGESVYYRPADASKNQPGLEIVEQGDNRQITLVDRTGQPLEQHNVVYNGQTEVSRTMISFGQNEAGTMVPQTVSYHAPGETGIPQQQGPDYAMPPGATVKVENGQATLVEVPQTKDGLTTQTSTNLETGDRTMTVQIEGQPDKTITLKPGADVPNPANVGDGAIIETGVKLDVQEQIPPNATVKLQDGNRIVEQPAQMKDGLTTQTSTNLETGDRTMTVQVEGQPDKTITLKPGADVPNPANVGDGTVIEANSNLSFGATVGDGAKIGVKPAGFEREANTSLSVGVTVGNQAEIQAGTNLSYQTIVGDKAEIHMGTSINPHVQVGDEAKIGVKPEGFEGEAKTEIGYRTEIGDKAEIQAGSTVESNVQVGDGAKIGTRPAGFEGEAKTEIGFSTQVGNQAEIQVGTTVNSYVQIGDGAKIGVRPEGFEGEAKTEIGYKTEIGNQAEIHAGSTVNDMVQIGDGAKIGTRPAGFEGEAKTEISYRAEIGDKAEIQAGVTVGDGAVVGENAVISAGITVPSGAVIPDNLTLPQGSTVDKVGAETTITIPSDQGTIQVIANRDGSSFTLSEGATVNSGAVLGDGVQIGPNVEIPAGVTIGKDVEIPKGAIIPPNTAVPEGATVQVDPSGATTIKSLDAEGQEVVKTINHNAKNGETEITLTVDGEEQATVTLADGKPISVNGQSLDPDTVLGQDVHSGVIHADAQATTQAAQSYLDSIKAEAEAGRATPAQVKQAEAMLNQAKATEVTAEVLKGVDGPWMTAVRNAALNGGANLIYQMMDKYDDGKLTSEEQVEMARSVLIATVVTGSFGFAGSQIKGSLKMQPGTWKEHGLDGLTGVMTGAVQDGWTKWPLTSENLHHPAVTGAAGGLFAFIGSVMSGKKMGKFQLPTAFGETFAAGLGQQDWAGPFDKNYLSNPTNTPTSTPTNTPTNTPTSTPTSTPTNTPTSTPTMTVEEEIQDMKQQRANPSQSPAND